MSDIDLIIFDCDGVLVDSERLTNTVFAEMLNELGLSLTLDDMLDKFVGNSMTRCREIIEEMLGRAMPENFAEQYGIRTRLALESNLKPIDGVEEALRRIEIPYCTASSGDHAKMRTTLGITGLLPYFEGKLFSVTEVGRGKPHPDVFLYAAQQMGAEAQRCVVIEDTSIGVMAGVAAGMTVFGYTGTMSADKLMNSGASLVFSEMSLLPELIKA